MSCPIESSLRQYEAQIDQAVSENDARERFIEDAENEATLQKIPKDHRYSWVIWFTDQSIYRAKEGDSVNVPTAKEFYSEVKDGLVDLYEDDDDQEDDQEPTDVEMMSSFGPKWHDGL